MVAATLNGILMRADRCIGLKKRWLGRASEQMLLARETVQLLSSLEAEV
jgi:hypothetical protein